MEKILGTPHIGKLFFFFFNGVRLNVAMDVSPQEPFHTAKFGVAILEAMGGLC